MTGRAFFPTVRPENEVPLAAAGQVPRHGFSGALTHSNGGTINYDHYGPTTMVLVAFLIGLVCSCSFSNTGFPATRFCGLPNIP